MEKVHVRWMLQRDMPEVLAIEHESFDDPWTEQEFQECKDQKNVLPLIAEHKELIAGYILFAFSETKYSILNLAVAERYRHIGVGTRLMEMVKKNLRKMKRTRITAKVREANLLAQLFFKSQGFKAVSILPGYFLRLDGQHEDAYCMHFRLPVPVQVAAIK